jgi:hypothetical protein
MIAFKRKPHERTFHFNPSRAIPHRKQPHTEKNRGNYMLTTLWIGLPGESPPKE